MADSSCMGSARNFLSWVVLLGFAYLALWYLNDALYSAWLSGGPPTPYPVGWARRALAHASFSLAAVFLGFGLFRTIRHSPSVGRNTLVILAIGILLIVVPYIVRFVLTDICLDQGGRWSNRTIQCEK